MAYIKNLDIFLMRNLHLRFSRRLNQQTKIAGKGDYCHFMIRDFDLTLKHADATRVQSNSGFIKPQSARVSDA